MLFCINIYTLIRNKESYIGMENKFTWTNANFFELIHCFFEHASHHFIHHNHPLCKHPFHVQIFLVDGLLSGSKYNWTNKMFFNKITHYLYKSTIAVLTWISDKKVIEILCIIKSKNYKSCSIIEQKIILHRHL